MSNQTEDPAGYVFSRPTEIGSNRESLSHLSAPREDEKQISERILMQRTSAETGGTLQSFESSIDEDASGICNDPTHFRSGSGPFDFLLVNPSTNEIDARIGSATHKLRPRARAANKDSLIGYVENELTVFQQLYQSSCSVPVADGANADRANMMVMTEPSCERHSHGKRTRMELCDWSSSCGFQALSLTNAQSDGRDLGSLAQLFPDCESCMDEWIGPPMKFKLKPIHSHLETYSSLPVFFYTTKGNMHPRQQLAPLTPC